MKKSILISSIGAISANTDYLFDFKKKDDRSSWIDQLNVNNVCKLDLDENYSQNNFQFSAGQHFYDKDFTNGIGLYAKKDYSYYFVENNFY